MNEKRWMIYGAYGYSGELIAREAARQGLFPVLAGRNEAKLAALADELQLPFQAFSLDDATTLHSNLAEMTLVLHCAGPFSATSAPMIEACLQSKTHYLDITGEIAVFEHAHAQNERAKQAGVILCPGVGFDVIPTDCLAQTLKNALPDATHLALGFDSRSSMSAGTAKTSVEGLKMGGRIRRHGKIVSVPLAYQTRRINFGKREKLAVSIPWGDVSTAFYSTGIPNIEVYVPISPKAVRGMKLMRILQPFLGLTPVQNFLKKRIDKKVTGPTAAEREKAITYVWGEVRNAGGERKTGRIQTANGYVVTIFGSLEIAKKLLNNVTQQGSLTPSQIMGSDFVTRLPGSGEMVIA